MFVSATPFFCTAAMTFDMVLLTLSCAFAASSDCASTPTRIVASSGRTRTSPSPETIRMRTSSVLREAVSWL